MPRRSVLASPAPPCSQHRPRRLMTKAARARRCRPRTSLPSAAVAAAAPHRLVPACASSTQLLICKQLVFRRKLGSLFLCLSRSSVLSGCGVAAQYARQSCRLPSFLLRASQGCRDIDPTTSCITRAAGVTSRVFASALLHQSGNKSTEVPQRFNAHHQVLH